MFLAIDADILAYQAVSSAEFEMDWGGDIWSLSTDLGRSKRHFLTAGSNHKRQDRHQESCVLFSDHNDNFRKHVIRLTSQAGRKPGSH